jgi:aldose 1-epimerase
LHGISPLSHFYSLLSFLLWRVLFMLNSSRQLFGYTKDDLAVETLTLDNGILSCDIITFGAALRSLRVPDRSGIKRDVVLGYDTLEEYESHPGYLGAVVGRVANRIAGGRFTMNGQTYALAVNDPPNHLHGGNVFLTKSGLL